MHVKIRTWGILTIVPKQGVIVNSITLEDAREIYELRAAIETYSAKELLTFLQRRYRISKRGFSAAARICKREMLISLWKKIPTSIYLYLKI